MVASGPLTFLLNYIDNELLLDKMPFIFNFVAKTFLAKIYVIYVADT